MRNAAATVQVVRRNPNANRQRSDQDRAELLAAAPMIKYQRTTNSHKNLSQTLFTNISQTLKKK
jgi:hypothetical protein